MLFLAVFCGFLAEIQVEHYVEHQREKKYILSLKEELVEDTVKFATSMARVREIHPLLDSLYENLKNPTKYNFTIQGKWNVYINENNDWYLPSLTTIIQIKNSGNLRLIKNHELLKEVILYEAMVLNKLALNAQTVQDAREKIYDFEDKYCSYNDFRISLSNDLNQTKYGIANPKLNYAMPLITKDTVILNEFANTAVNYKSRLRGYADRVTQVNQQAEKLIKLINEVYHLK
jgi:hypothetical protein